MKKIIQILRAWFQSDIVRQYILGSFWMTVARMTWILSAFTIGILVVRKLGPNDFGFLNYISAYVGMFSIIVNLGLDGIIERKLVDEPGNESRILGNYFVFKLVFLFAMLVSLSFSFLFMADKIVILSCLIIASGYLLHPLSVVQCHFFSAVKGHYNAWSQIACCLLYNTIRLFAVLNSSSLLVYFIAEALLVGFTNGMMFLFYWKNVNSPFKWSFCWKEVLELLPLALPMSITVIFSMIYARTDMLMLNHYHGAEAVGFYTIAARFSENWLLFIHIFAQVFRTAVISAHGISGLEYSKQLHRYYFMLFWISLPPILLTLAFGRVVCTFLYGETFAVSASILNWHILTLPCNGLLLAFYCHAICGQRLKIIAAVFCLGALLNVPLNMLLIQSMGTSGAAISSATAMPLGIALALLFTHEGRKDLIFMLRSISSWPSFRLGQISTAKQEETV